MNDRLGPRAATCAEPSAGVSVIVPTLNERASIGELLGRLARSLDALGCPAEVIVVDDGSPDGTADVAEALARSLPLRVAVLRRRGPRSLSLSVIEGARAARHPTVAVLDADLSHEPEALPDILRPVLAGTADLAVGSRHAAGGEVSGWPLRRRLLSAAASAPARLLTGVCDPLSGYFAARRPLLLGSALRPRGFKILLEILGRYRGLRTVEVPIRFRDRRAGESKLGSRQALEFLRQLASLIGARLRRLRADSLSPEPTHVQDSSDSMEPTNPTNPRLEAPR